jgi:23S rRNA (uracil1939-C5)-methyltransferase
MSQHDESEAASRDRSSPAVPDDPGPLRVTGLASGGDGVGRLSDGRVVFVEGGVPGDHVELVDFVARKKMARARVGRVIEASPDRVQPRCSHFGSCGGCLWQHVRYETQLDEKRRIVRDALERIGGLVLEQELEIIGSPDPYGYRARARLVESNGRVGYRMRGSHAIAGIDECPILVPAAQEGLIQLTQNVGSAAHRADAEEPKTSTRKRRARVEWIVSAGTTGPATIYEAGHKAGHKTGPKGRGKGGRSTERRSVTLEVLGERLRASSESFIQGNALLWDALAEEVRSQCTARRGESTPERFIELYAGIGFLTLPLARRGLSGVAIESNRSALADLGANLSSSGLEKQVEVIRGRVEARGDLAKLFATAEVLLTDPPRVGLDAKVRDAIASSGPARLVYVSCDPATLARDLRVFAEAGYALKSVRALDLFPQTPHVEVVARLERV